MIDLVILRQAVVADRSPDQQIDHQINRSTDQQIDQQITRSRDQQIHLLCPQPIDWIDPHRPYRRRNRGDQCGRDQDGTRGRRGPDIAGRHAVEHPREQAAEQLHGDQPARPGRRRPGSGHGAPPARRRCRRWRPRRGESPARACASAPPTRTGRRRPPPRAAPPARRRTAARCAAPALRRCARRGGCPTTAARAIGTAGATFRSALRTAAAPAPASAARTAMTTSENGNWRVVK